VSSKNERTSPTLPESQEDYRGLLDLTHENDRVSFTQEGDIFIRSDEDERNALYSIFQPLRDFDRLLVFRYIFVAENIDFHLVPF
jgi:hypothetical protein